MTPQKKVGPDDGVRVTLSGTNTTLLLHVEGDITRAWFACVCGACLGLGLCSFGFTLCWVCCIRGVCKRMQAYDFLKIFIKAHGKGSLAFNEIVSTVRFLLSFFGLFTNLQPILH